MKETFLNDDEAPAMLKESPLFPPTRWTGQEASLLPDKQVVGMGVWLLRFSNFNTVESKFNASFRIVFKYHSFRPLENITPFKVVGNRTYYHPKDLADDIPARELELKNAITFEHEPSKFYDQDEQVGLLFHQHDDPQSVLTLEMKYSGEFKYIFNLRRFPFDRQDMCIEFRIWRGSDLDYKRVFVPLKESFPIDKDFLVFPDFDVHYDLLKTEILSQKDGCLESARFLAPVSRKPWFFFFAATLPLAITLSTALAGFAIDVNDRGDRLAHTTTLLLAAIAIKFVVTTDIPRVPYATVLDYDNLLCYLYLLALTVVFAVVDESTDKLAFYISAIALLAILVFMFTSHTVRKLMS